MNDSTSAEGAARDVPVPTRPPMPAPVMAKVRHAVNAGLVLCAMSLIGALGAGSAAGWINAAVVLALTAGILVKNRACAVLMAVNPLWALASKWADMGFGSRGLMIVMTWYFGAGVVGVFQYHRFRRG